MSETKNTTEQGGDSNLEDTEAPAKQEASRPAERAADSNAVSGRGGAGTAVAAVLALLIALAAAGFGAWQAYDSRRAKAELELELARKLAEIEAIGSDSRRLSGSARDIARDAEARLGQLEARIVGMQNQRLALESLYQELSRSRDEWTLAEVEQILLVASHQLQLASNVKAALIALEAADARLAKSDRPQLTQLRRVIADDIERLKASPFVDVTGIGLKLERVIGMIDQMPLVMETRPAPVAQTPVAGSQDWRLLLNEIWRDVRSLVRIERIDTPEAPLLAPEQAFFLRENLKLRLLGARLALLARDQATYKSDLAAARQWLEAYYDVEIQAVASSIETLAQLAQSDIRIALPDVGASLDAVRSYRLANEPSAP